MTQLRQPPDNVRPAPGDVLAYAMLGVALSIAAVAVEDTSSRSLTQRFMSAFSVAPGASGVSKTVTAEDADSQSVALAAAKTPAAHGAADALR